jgi:hypothetical protein
VDSTNCCRTPSSDKSVKWYYTGRLVWHAKRDKTKPCPSLCKMWRPHISALNRMCIARQCADQLTLHTGRNKHQTLVVPCLCRSCRSIKAVWLHISHLVTMHAELKRGCVGMCHSAVAVPASAVVFVVMAQLLLPFDTNSMPVQHVNHKMYSTKCRS